MAHDYNHAFSNCKRAFAFGVAFNVCYIVVEAIFGVMADSLALLADAGHNLSDVLGRLLAWGANSLVQRRPTARHTHRCVNHLLWLLN